MPGAAVPQAPLLRQPGGRAEVGGRVVARPLQELTAAGPHPQRRPSTDCAEQDAQWLAGVGAPLRAILTTRCLTLEALNAAEEEE